MNLDFVFYYITTVYGHFLQLRAHVDVHSLLLEVRVQTSFA